MPDCNQDVPAIWEGLESVGLSTTEACGDTPRNMLGCPLAGIADDEIVDGAHALASLAPFVGDPAFSNLPRKYKTAVCGCAQHCTIHEINDLAFVGVHGYDGVPGFDLWVGGGLSTNPMYGQRLGAFVAPDQVPVVWAAITSLFRDHGYRRLRSRARMKFLVADWGPEKSRDVLESEYLHAQLPDGPPPAVPSDPRRDHVGVHRQKAGRFYLGLAPRVGRMSGTLLSQVATLAEQNGSERARTTIEQKLVILDIAEDRLPSLTADLNAIDLPTQPSAFRRQTMSCTGIEFCKLAIVNTKDRAMKVIAELERRLPTFNEPITFNFNGCPNSCARIQTADIGLRGQIMTTSRGEQVEGFQVQLGGGLSADVGFGRKVRGLKVAADDLLEYLERILGRYCETQLGEETFASWVARATETELA